MSQQDVANLALARKRWPAEPLVAISIGGHLGFYPIGFAFVFSRYEGTPAQIVGIFNADDSATVLKPEGERS